MDRLYNQIIAQHFEKLETLNLTGISEHTPLLMLDEFHTYKHWKN